jgi:hypothetical protein
MTRDTEVSRGWNDPFERDREGSPPPLDPLWQPEPIMIVSPLPVEEEANSHDWKLSFPVGGAALPPVPVEMNHPRSPTWDETVNWSKSAHRSTASGSSVGEDDSLASTQLFPLPGGAPETLYRVVSYDSSTFSSGGMPGEMGVLTPPPAFFAPRRRLNSTVPDVPDAVTVSFGGGNSWSDTEDEDRLATTNGPVELDANSPRICIPRGWRDFWLRYLVTSGSHRSSTHRKAPPTRRNLLFLFLIAVYTTFGLASPHLRAALPPDALTVGPLPATTIAPVVALEISDPESRSPPRQALRGRVAASPDIKGHLSFARGPQNPRQLLYRPRRDEMNAFLHQSAVQEEEASSGAWYFNCLVLVAIAMWWSLKERSAVRRG